MYNAFLLKTSMFCLFLNNSRIQSAILASYSLGKKVYMSFVTYSTYSSIKIDNLSLYLKPLKVNSSYSGSSSPFTFLTPSSNFLELIN